MLIIDISIIILLLRFNKILQIIEISTAENTTGKADGSGGIWFCLWLKCRSI